jgi:hypothetical protein
MFIIVHDLEGREIPISVEQICCVRYLTMDEIKSELIKYELTACTGAAIQDRAIKSAIVFSNNWSLYVQQTVTELIDGLQQAQRAKLELVAPD